MQLQQSSKATPTSPVSGYERLVLALIVLTGAAALATLFLLAFRYPAQTPSSVFNFRFNPYVLLSLLGVLCNGALLIYINRPRLRTPETPWFSLYLVMNIIWGAGEAATRLSATPGGAVFWWQIESIGLVFAPCAAFLFAIAYAYQDSFVRHVTPVVAMVTLGVFAEYLVLGTGVIVDKNPAHAVLLPWGYFPYYRSTYFPLLIWLLAGYAGAQIILIRHFRSTKDWRKVRVFIYGSLVPIIIGMTTNGILSKIGLHIPPSAVIATAIFAAIVAYTMVRFGLLRLNPRMFAPGLLQTMSEGVIVTDPTLHIEFFNNRALDLLLVASLEGKNLLDLFSIDQASSFSQLIIEPLKKAHFSQNEEMQIRSTQGVNIPVSVSAAKVLDAQGRLVGYSFVLTDLRRIKAAEYQLQLEKQNVERQVAERTHELNEVTARLEASLGSLPFGFAIIAAKNQIVYHNQSLTRLLKRPIPTDPSESAETLKQIATEYSSALDVMKCIGDCEASGRTIEQSVSFGPAFFRFIFVPIIDSTAGQKATGTVMIVEDITEAKVLERSREEFFSIASHELRTPLTAIRGNTSLLLRYYADTLKDPNIYGMVSDINTSCARLIELVNDFLDTSRLEQGKISFKPRSFPLDEVLEQVVYEMGTVLREKNLYCKVDERITKLGSLPPVFADPDRAKQILYNLIGNAAKFTVTGGISVGAQLAGDHLKVTVTDTGPGIPIENQKLLFRKFQQAGSSILSRDTTRGTGLGLYISKLLSEGMHGSIGLESSTPGKGTTFFFTLPVANADSQTADKPGTSESLASKSLTQKKLYIVEDDPYLQKLYAGLFEHDEWQTEVGSYGEGKMGKLVAAKADLILLDITKSKTVGLELLAKLRENESLQTIPVIALIDKDEAGISAKAAELGAAGCLVRSDFSPEQLHEEIKKRLREEPAQSLPVPA